MLGIAFSPDGQFLACAGTSGVVKLWDLNQERFVRQLKGTPSPSHQTLAFRQDREWIAAGGFKGFHVWDMKTGTNLFRGAAPVFSLAFSPDGSRLLTAGLDGTLRLWDTESWSEAMVLHVGAGEIYSAEFSPDGTRIVAGCDDGGVRIWHRASKAQAQALAAPTP